MNRNEEYKELINKFDDTPLKLDFTFERAQMQRKAQELRVQTRKKVLAPVWLLATAFIVFVILVNVSPPIANAAGRTPYLRDLAKFVTLSPSLWEAVLNIFHT